MRICGTRLLWLQILPNTKTKLFLIPSFDSSFEESGLFLFVFLNLIREGDSNAELTPAEPAKRNAKPSASNYQKII